MRLTKRQADKLLDWCEATIAETGKPRSIHELREDATSVVATADIGSRLGVATLLTLINLVGGRIALDRHGQRLVVCALIP